MPISTGVFGPAVTRGRGAVVATAPTWLVTPALGPAATGVLAELSTAPGPLTVRVVRPVMKPCWADCCEASPFGASSWPPDTVDVTGVVVPQAARRSALTRPATLAGRET